MAKPKWQERLQTLLDGNPLYMSQDGVNTCSICKSDPKARKLTLRQVVNYGWNKCDICKKEYH
jgi:hypothetical protein